MNKPSRGRLWSLGALCAIILGLFVIDKVVPSKAVRFLPKGATEIQEDYKVVGISGDFHRLLKARIPKNQVAEYARKVGAPNKEQGGAERDYFSWSGGPQWFSPKEPPLYYSSEKRTRTLVGWEKGFVYFDVVAW